jgi:GT2 family glycosyltransferase
MTERSDPRTNATVTCIVVSYHRVDAARRALARLAHPEIEVVLVNVDGDREIADIPGDHRLLSIEGNPGYAAAVNAGTSLAGTDLVVFANDDAVIDADSILALVAPIAEGVADVTVPMVVDANGVVERTIAAIPTPASLVREWALLPDHPIRGLDGHAAVEKWRLPRVPERIDAAAAVVVATRRTILESTPLPEAYFLYWEESEWFWRLRERGSVVQYRPEVTCEHDGGRVDVRPDKSRLLARNAVRCVRRTQGRAAAAAALAVVIVWNLRLLLVDLARSPASGRGAGRHRVAARRAGLVAALGSWRELR